MSDQENSEFPKQKSGVNLTLNSFEKYLPPFALWQGLRMLSQQQLQMLKIMDHDHEKSHSKTVLFHFKDTEHAESDECIIYSSSPKQSLSNISPSSTNINALFENLHQINQNLISTANENFIHFQDLPVQNNKIQESQTGQNNAEVQFQDQNIQLKGDIVKVFLTFKPLQPIQHRCSKHASLLCEHLAASLLIMKQLTYLQNNSSYPLDFEKQNNQAQTDNEQDSNDIESVVEVFSENWLEHETSKNQTQTNIFIQQLYCAICWEKIRQPVILPCQSHLICLHCAKQHAMSSPRHKKQQFNHDNVGSNKIKTIYKQQYILACPVCKSQKGKFLYNNLDEIRANHGVKRIVSILEQELRHSQQLNKSYLAQISKSKKYNQGQQAPQVKENGKKSQLSSTSSSQKYNKKYNKAQLKLLQQQQISSSKLIQHINDNNIPKSNQDLQLNESSSQDSEAYSHYKQQLDEDQKDQIMFQKDKERLKQWLEKSYI